MKYPLGKPNDWRVEFWQVRTFLHPLFVGPSGLCYYFDKFNGYQLGIIQEGSQRTFKMIGRIFPAEELGQAYSDRYRKELTSDQWAMLKTGFFSESDFYG